MLVMMTVISAVTKSVTINVTTILIAFTVIVESVESSSSGVLTPTEIQLIVVATS